MSLQYKNNLLIAEVNYNLREGSIRLEYPFKGVKNEFIFEKEFKHHYDRDAVIDKHLFALYDLYQLFIDNKERMDEEAKQIREKSSTSASSHGTSELSIRLTEKANEYYEEFISQVDASLISKRTKQILPSQISQHLWGGFPFEVFSAADFTEIETEMVRKHGKVWSRIKSRELTDCTRGRYFLENMKLSPDFGQYDLKIPPHFGYHGLPTHNFEIVDYETYFKEEKDVIPLFMLTGQGKTVPSLEGERGILKEGQLFALMGRSIFSGVTHNFSVCRKTADDYIVLERFSSKAPIVKQA